MNFRKGKDFFILWWFLELKNYISDELTKYDQKLYIVNNHIIKLLNKVWKNTNLNLSQTLHVLKLKECSSQKIMKCMMISH